MLGTLARWTVPTVATIALNVRPLQAQASCPPCQKRSGSKCKPCNVSQILGCQCEPCLGAPYCSGASPGAQPGAAPSTFRAPGGQGFSSSPFRDPREDALRQIQIERMRRAQGPDELFPDPFRRSRTAEPARSPSLYERLQQTPPRRRP